MCSPFWVSFFREINWQSAKIYQHIARLSDKLKQWGNQLWSCRCVRPPSTPPPTPQSLRKAGWVSSCVLIYLFEPLIHQPLQMTLAADNDWIPPNMTGVWGGSDYHKKHTNQRGTMNPANGRRRSSEVLTFWGVGEVEAASPNQQFHPLITRFEIFPQRPRHLTFFFGLAAEQSWQETHSAQ